MKWEQGFEGQERKKSLRIFKNIIFAD